MPKFITDLFNSGTLQTVLYVLAGASSGLVWLLQQLGCTPTEAGSLICMESNLPAWIPESFEPTITLWLVALAGISGFLGIIVRLVKGTAVTSSAPISSSGKIGTVTQKQVDSVSAPDAPKKIA